MQPSEHFIVAVVPVVAVLSVRDRQLPPLIVLAVTFVGSQFPDLVDKPLAHALGILPSGRVFMHSLPIAIPFLLGVLGYAYMTDRRRLGHVFAFAQLSHILADNYQAVLRPQPQLPPDVLWPLAPPISRPIVPHWAGEGGINIALWTLFSITILSIVGYYVVRDLRGRVGN